MCAVRCTEIEPGIRLELNEDCNGPRYIALPDGVGGRLCVCNADLSNDPRSGSGDRVVSATTANGPAASTSF